ncbi:MAG: low specificity L-threonine aldolase [Alphaproteobacteria bacterium]|nr:low specificity L-threonine aldolase [Alphaproteobacteria bacterium]
MTPMPERIVDLRSDFLTRPTPAMIAAMNAACARPWGFDFRDDPDQRTLEAELAALLGHEDSLVMPTSTMANQIALLLLARPGEIVLGPDDLHFAISEAGAATAVAGVAVQGLGSQQPPLEAWRAALRAKPDTQRSRIAAIAIENTHNRAGGVAIDGATTQAILALARAHGLAAHLDGARLFNAAVALDVAPATLAAGFDTITVSLNKGLGAPIGGALVGSRARIAEALILRQRLGGGIRPTAVFAAAARVALAGWRDVAEDHRRAAALIAGIEGTPGLRVVKPAYPTNIVVIELERLDVAAAEAKLAASGVLVIPFGPRRLRLIVYRGIEDVDIARAIAACRALATDTGGPRT